MTKKTIFFLTLIFTLGLFLRFYRLDQNIPELYADEAGHYFLPHIYNQIFYKIFSFTWLFGFTPLGVRAASAFYGSLTCLVIYFFAKSVSHRTTISLLTSLLLVVSPWSFAISRLGHTHVVIITLLITLHTAIFLNAKNFKQIFFSLIPLIISLRYYPSMVVIVPFILLAIFLISKTETKKIMLMVIGIVMVLVIPLLIQKFQLLDQKSRAMDLAVWRDVNVTADSNLYRGLARLSEPTIFSFYQNPEKIANKIVFNYPVSILSIFTKNYLSFFSLDFLFLKGDNILRHSTGMVGNLYPFLLPFMIYGAFLFFRDQSLKNKTIFMAWILASPIPATITKDGASYLLRVVTLMPFLTYFCALGIVQSFELFKSNFSKIVYGVVIGTMAIFSVYYYFYGYFHVYPTLASDSFEYGFKDLADFQTRNPGKMLVIWDDKYPYSHFCFWQKLSYKSCEYSKTNTRVTVGQSRVDLALPEVIFSLPNPPSDLSLITKSYTPKYLALPSRYFNQFPGLFVNQKPVSQTNYFKIYEIK